MAVRSPTILFLNLPPKTFIGIDLCSFNSSPKFQGITDIPPGLHFLYSGSDASLSIRHGHWLNFHPQGEGDRPQVHILQWDNDLETLRFIDPHNRAGQQITNSLPPPQSRDLVNYNALRDASANLQAEQNTNSPNTPETADHWPHLIRHVTARLLTRILTTEKSYRNGDDDVDHAVNVRDNSAGDGWTLSSISCAPSDTEHIPGLSEQETNSVLSPAATLTVTSVNLKQTWPASAIGRDRTEKARDRSWYLGHLIDELGGLDGSARRVDGSEHVQGTTSAVGGRQQGAQDLLGEFQFCFVMVLTLANYSCLEQWKRSLGVFFTCKTALVEVEGFFVEVVRVLTEQLGRVEDVEGGLFDLGDEQGSAWLRALLKLFHGNVNDVFGENSGGALKTSMKELEDWLREQYGWEDESTLLRRGTVQLEDGEVVEMQMQGVDEDEETGEYAPVIV